MKPRNYYVLFEGSYYPYVINLRSTLPVICAPPTSTCGLNYEIRTNDEYVVLNPDYAGKFQNLDWKPAESRAYTQLTAVQLYIVRDLFVSPYFKPSLLQIKTPPLPYKTVAGETYPNIWSGYTNNLASII